MTRCIQTSSRKSPLFAVALALGLLTCHASAAGVPAADLPPDFPTGARVTISAEDVNAALLQLSQQSNLTFQFRPASVPQTNGLRPLAGVNGAGPAQSFNFKDVPLWQAVRQIQDSLHGQGDIEAHGTVGTYNPTVGEPFSNAGAFVLRVNGVTHNADYSRADPEIFYVSMLPISDASARILAFQHASLPTQALDDAGHNLVPDSPAPVEWDMVSERGGGGSMAQPARILLQRPKSVPAAGSTLKALQGTLPVLIATKIDTITISLPTNDTRQYGDVSASIKYARGNFGGAAAAANALEVNVRFTRPPGTADDDWARMAAAFSGTRVRFLSGATQVTTQGGGESTNSQSRLTTVIYSPAADNPNPQVLIEIPAEFKQIAVPYRFENLPLP